jgi:hypothetical protein
VAPGLLNSKVGVNSGRRRTSCACRTVCMQDGGPALMRTTAQPRFTCMPFPARPPPLRPTAGRDERV